MSLGNLLPQRAHDGLNQALDQLPWDVHADIGNTYLAVLLQDTGWIQPRTPTPEIIIEPEIDAAEPVDPNQQEPINLNYA